MRWTHGRSSAEAHDHEGKGSTMEFKGNPGIQYAYRRNLQAQDVLGFIAELETLGPQTAIAHHAGKLQAAPGVWVRIGNYRLTNDSFIDPSDLMLYVEYFYELSEGGPVEALELNHGAALPAGALPASTVDELLDALVRLDLGDGEPEGRNAAPNEPSAAENESADREEPAASESENANPSGQTAADGEPSPSRLDGMLAIGPSGAAEMRGALVKGWHAQYYEAPDGDALLVFD